MNNQGHGQGPYQYANDDEISLVDLAKILIKRWKTMTVVFLVVVLGALAYVLTMTRTYEYVSIYQVAEQAPASSNGPVGTLEAPAAVVAKINNLYLGPVTRELLNSAELEQLPFEVSTSNPENTYLVRLSSEAAQEDSALVDEMHTKVLERVQEGQQALMEKKRESLEHQLMSAERSLESAQRSSNAYSSELIATYSNRVADIQDRLNQLRDGQVSRVAVKSLKPVGVGRSLIMVMAVVFGIMVAVMAAFFMQFFSVVRSSLKAE